MWASAKRETAAAQHACGCYLQVQEPPATLIWPAEQAAAGKPHANESEHE